MSARVREGGLRAGWPSFGRRLGTWAALPALTGLLAACGGRAVIDGSASGEGGWDSSTSPVEPVGPVVTGWDELIDGTAAGEGGADGHASGPLTITLSSISVVIGC